MLPWAADRSGDVQWLWGLLYSYRKDLWGKLCWNWDKRGWQSVPRDCCVPQSVDKCTGTFDS